jgi:hypothetical protein
VTYWNSIDYCIMPPLGRCEGLHEEVIAGDHLDPHAGGLSLLDGLRRVGSGRVEEGDQPQDPPLPRRVRLGLKGSGRERNWVGGSRAGAHGESCPKDALPSAAIGASGRSWCAARQSIGEKQAYHGKEADPPLAGSWHILVQHTKSMIISVK